MFDTHHWKRQENVPFLTHLLSVCGDNISADPYNCSVFLPLRSNYHRLLESKNWRLTAYCKQCCILRTRSFCSGSYLHKTGRFFSKWVFSLSVWMISVQTAPVQKVAARLTAKFDAERSIREAFVNLADVHNRKQCSQMTPNPLIKLGFIFLKFSCGTGEGVTIRNIRDIPAAPKAAAVQPLICGQLKRVASKQGLIPVIPSHTATCILNSSLSLCSPKCRSSERLKEEAGQGSNPTNSNNAFFSRLRALKTALTQTSVC